MDIKGWLGEDNTLGHDIWTKKYKYKEESFDEWLSRVSDDNEDIERLIKEKKFLLGGRILANRGLQKLGKKITYSNCYVLPAPEDNIESIFDTAKEMARTYSYGGGVGINLDKLRPKGASINNAAESTSGAVSFMDLYDKTTNLISQNGRRGALMITLSTSHPDIEEFIDIKNDLNKIQKANISIRVDNEFMERVRHNLVYMTTFTLEDGNIITKEIDARKLFMRLAENNWNSGEPGLLFWDSVKENSFMSEYENYYENVNPCGELPLPKYGACSLCSVNLEAYVVDGVFLKQELSRDLKTIVEAMDGIIDESAELHPLKQQTEAALKYRPLGIGFMGLADLFIKLGYTYGDDNSIILASAISKTFLESCVGASAFLAGKKGAFPEYDEQKVINSGMFKKLSKYTQDLVLDHGLRNAQLLTVAPTGSISTMLGISGGIEPIFKFKYKRRTESLHGADTSYDVYTKIAKEYMDENETSKLPTYFIESSQINFKHRIDVQSAIQEHFDNSISSTVNLPENATIEDISEIYLYAYLNNLKGITVFRDNCSRLGILTSGEPKPTKQHRPEVLEGTTTKIKTGCGNLYVTVNKIDGVVKEVFTRVGRGGGCPSQSDATARLIAIALKHNVPVEEITKQIKGIRCVSCIKKDDANVLSCPDAIGKILNEQKTSTNERKGTAKCPECGGEISNAEGCIICPECGYSKCG